MFTLVPAFLGSWKYHFWRLVTQVQEQEGFLFAYFFCFCVATHLLWWTSDMLGALPGVHRALSHSVLATILSTKMNLRLSLAPRPVWLQAFAFTFSSLPCLGSSNMEFPSWRGRDAFLQSKTFLWCGGWVAVKAFLLEHFIILAHHVWVITVPALELTIPLKIKSVS